MHRAAAIGVVVCALALASQGCVANKYKLARSDTPHAPRLEVAFPASPPLAASLSAVIVYAGPGSWKREALWDEYVVTLQNQGEEPLTVNQVTLRELSNSEHFAELRDPWSLEKRSRQLEKSYRSAGKSFARAVAPAALIHVAGGVAGVAMGGLGGAGVALASTVVVIPAYYLVVVGVNRHNRKAVEAEFQRRRLALPFTLAPGATITASAFFPMVRDPHTLEVNWKAPTIDEAVVALPLDFLRGLHVPNGELVR